MDKTTTKRNCCKCNKLFRQDERCRYLENCKELLQYVIENKLLELELPLHNSCFMKLYAKKKNTTSSNSVKTENDSTMDVDIQKVDAATQTDPVLKLSTESIDMTDTKSFFTAAALSTTSPPVVDSHTLPFFRLLNSHQKCSICKIYFGNKKTRSVDINNELRVNCLLDYHVYIQENSRCCMSHLIDGKLSQKSIEIIKKEKLNMSTITRDELIELFQELKQEIQNKEKKLNELKDRAPLNFDDDEEPMSDQNYHVLTGLTRDQFNDLCSYIPPSSLRHSDIRTPRMAIAVLLVKLRLAGEANKIKDYIEKLKDKNGKQPKWADLNAADSVANFPKMSFDELQELTLGTYQLKQARSYTTEHLSEDGAYLVKVTNQRQNLLRAQIQSRHRNAVKYDLYIQYNTQNITGWYCKCPNGSRVVGCCAHIASVMYYLAFARYSPQHLQPRSSKYYTSLTDAVDYSEISDTDTSDDEDDSNTLYYLT
ncbi:unnamed protein product [Rotaria sp. Silwood2]|nr:unnamed protein product [Rotaria sp. Silwood2]